MNQPKKCAASSNLERSHRQPRALKLHGGCAWLLQELHHMTDSRQCKYGRSYTFCMSSCQKKQTNWSRWSQNYPITLDPDLLSSRLLYQQSIMSFYRVCPLLSVIRCHMNLSFHLSSSSIWNCFVWLCTAAGWYHDSQTKIFLWLKFSYHWVNLWQNRLFR